MQYGNNPSIAAYYSSAVILAEVKPSGAKADENDETSQAGA